MLPRVESSLRDIAVACGEILDHSKGDGDRIIEDRLLALAIERLLLIVGEAMVRIRDDAPDLLESIRDARAIIGMRNAIVHGYDTIDPVRIRDAVKLAVPELLVDVERLLTT
jgi:uncharacterized protein with HEPN domain